jgi:tRNA-specific 2-thiouridylase
VYALRADPRTNTLVVGPRESLACRRVSVRGRLHVPVTAAEAKLRYRSAAVSARVTATDAGFELELDEPAYAVARGQAAVLYADDTVVGAGTIVGAG